MAIVGTISISALPLTPGATTLAQPPGIAAPTFSTPPVQGERDILTYTNGNGQVRTLQYRPTEMTAGDILAGFRSEGVSSATLDRYGRLSLPGVSLTGTGSSAAYSGF